MTHIHKDINIDDVHAARERIGPSIVQTPFLESVTLGHLCGRRVFCKFENLQMTGSFKERGALNKLHKLSEREKNRGIIAASAGNHAQGLAYHGGRLGIPVTIVMPKYTPLVKVTHTEKMGAHVIQVGSNFDEAHAHAVTLAEEKDITFVHPFDDPYVIAGQGTLGLELLESEHDIDTVLVPIGGGGLVSGIALTIKHLRPDIKVIGVESELVASMTAAMAGRSLKRVGRTIADGIAVQQVGELTSALVKTYVDGIITVSDSQISHAVQLLLEIEKTLVEGAGAVGLAALLYRSDDIPGRRTALVLSGGNMDITMLAKIIEKGLIADGRLTRLSVRVPDIPGGLAAVTDRISKENGNIRDVVHQRAFGDAPLGEAYVEFVVETRSHEHVKQLVAALRQEGYEADHYVVR